MIDKIQNEIVSLVTFIPGIEGIASIDLSKSNSPLSEEEWLKGVSIIEGQKGYEISIALIVKRDVASKTVSHELDSAIRVAAKQNKFKIDKINIYVRGVK